MALEGPAASTSSRKKPHPLSALLLKEQKREAFMKMLFVSTTWQRFVDTCSYIHVSRIDTGLRKF